MVTIKYIAGNAHKYSDRRRCDAEEWPVSATFGLICALGSVRGALTYTNEPLGDLEVVADFLPPPAELAFREEGVKVTLALSKKSVEFFKFEASKHQTQYQRMIRRLLDAYVEAHEERPVAFNSSGTSRKRVAATSQDRPTR